MCASIIFDDSAEYLKEVKAVYTKVAIVKAGEWGALSQDKGSYDSFVEYLERAVEEATTGSDPDPRKAAESRVVESTQEALSWLGKRYGNERGVIVFVSRSMYRDARQVASDHPAIRVVLFTGLIPNGEVVFINKGWSLGRKQVERVLLHD